MAEDIFLRPQGSPENTGPENNHGASRAQVIDHWLQYPPPRSQEVTANPASVWGPRADRPNLYANVHSDNVSRIQARDYLAGPFYRENATNVQRYIEQLPNDVDRRILPTVRAIEYSLAGGNSPALLSAIRTLDGNEQDFSQVMAAVKRQMDPIGLRLQTRFENGHGTMILPETWPSEFVNRHNTGTVAVSTDGTLIGLNQAGRPNDFLSNQLHGPDQSIRNLADLLGRNAQLRNDGKSPALLASPTIAESPPIANHAPDYNPSIFSHPFVTMSTGAMGIAGLADLAAGSRTRPSGAFALGATLIGATALPYDACNFYNSTTTSGRLNYGLSLAADLGLAVAGYKTFRSPAAAGVVALAFGSRLALDYFRPNSE